MTHTEIPLARRDVIADRLKKGQPVIANALAIEFGVSEDAIRRDLRALASEGVCRRVYGGALPIAGDAPMMQRVGEHREQKTSLAAAAVSIIQPGELIFLDSGSTNLAMVDLLPHDYALTVVTNSMVIAAALLVRTDIRLLVLGGEVTHQMGGCIDSSAAIQMSRMKFDRAFIGVCAVSASEGFCAFDPADATFKRLVIQASKSSIALVTNEKFSISAPYQIAGLTEMHQLVVEHNVSREEIDLLKKVHASVSIIHATL